MADSEQLVETYARINRQGIVLAAINLVYQESMRCDSMKAFTTSCLRIVESITASRLSFIGEVGSDGLCKDIAISEAALKHCAMGDHRGQHPSPGSWEMGGFLGRILNGKTLLFNSHPQSESDKVRAPEGHPPIECFLGVPFIHSGKTIGMVGVANRAGGYDSEDQAILESVTPTIIESLLRKRAEEELRKSQSLLRAVMDGTPDAVYVKDTESRILMCNPALGEIAGLPIEEIIGKTDAEYYGDVSIGQLLRENDLRIMASGKSEVVEESALTPTGYRIYISAKAPYRDALGRIIGIVGISHDITERKQMEESLRQARNELEQRVRERTAELSQTVSVLNEEVLKRIDTERSLRDRSEQLRLMASKLTMAEQRERQRLAQVLHDGLQQVLVAAKYRLALVERSKDVKQSTSEIAELIDDAMETSRSLTAELSPPILHQGGLFAALEWLARWMHDKHGLDVDLLASEPIESPSEELAIFLFQGVRELLFNVIKHAEKKEAHVYVSRCDGRIQVTVADKGTGFNPAQLRAAGGRVGGFGLFSISERLGLLGGAMEIDSAPGRGSRITLLAPVLMSPGQSTGAGGRVSTVSVAIASDQKRDLASSERRIRVALVDDHMVMRQGLAGLLRAEPDMEIVGEASDGGAAVNLVRNIRPDVVLMDVTMPGMDGIQATRIIHQETPDVKIIGLSMFEEGEQAVAMREAGAVDYLTKTGPSDTVVSAIRRHSIANCNLRIPD